MSKLVNCKDCIYYECVSCGFGHAYQCRKSLLNIHNKNKLNTHQRDCEKYKRKWWRLFAKKGNHA